MGDRRTVRTIGVAEPGRAAVFSYEEDPPTAGQFRVDTLFTGLSAGTELTYLKGTNPYLHSSWDAEQGVFVEGVRLADLPGRGARLHGGGAGDREPHGRRRGG